MMDEMAALVVSTFTPYRALPFVPAKESVSISDHYIVFLLKAKSFSIDPLPLHLGNW
jgi:hypothetical protein